ncbi:MAG: hypothetical protein AAGC44_07075 [Planctomycetota bacterium]
METKPNLQPVVQARMSRNIAPEDIRPGMFIAVSRSICQLIPSSVEEGWDKQPRTVDVPFIPQDSGQAMKVLEVCVPFVLVELPCGLKQSLDLRRQSVMRLSFAFGQAAFRKPVKANNQEGKKSEKDKGKKKGKRN